MLLRYTLDQLSCFKGEAVETCSGGAGLVCSPKKLVYWFDSQGSHNFFLIKFIFVKTLS